MGFNQEKTTQNLIRTDYIYFFLISSNHTLLAGRVNVARRRRRSRQAVIGRRELHGCTMSTATSCSLILFNKEKKDHVTDAVSGITRRLRIEVASLRTSV